MYAKTQPTSTGAQRARRLWAALVAPTVIGISLAPTAATAAPRVRTDVVENVSPSLATGGMAATGNASAPGASSQLSWEGTVGTRHPALGASSRHFSASAHYAAASNGVPVWLLMSAGIVLLIVGVALLLLVGRRRTGRRAVR